MADLEAIADAIWGQAATSLGSTYPLVMPNEPYDPRSPAGRFSAFAANAPFILTRLDYVESDHESMGSAGVRNRVGLFVCWCFGAPDVGPGPTLRMADAVAGAFRDQRLLSGEVQFGEPVVDEVGEVIRDEARHYMTRCIAPFETFSTAP